MKFSTSRQQHKGSMLKISIFFLLSAAAAAQLAHSSSSNSTSSQQAQLKSANNKQNHDLQTAKVTPKSAPVSGRAGRMLDLDKLAGDVIGAVKETPSVSGNRQSRILSEDISTTTTNNGGQVEERSKKGSSKKMSIKGFIPIVSMEGASQLSDLAGGGGADNSEDADDNEPQQQQQSNLRDHLATSYGGQTSIGHASFPSAAASNGEQQWQQVDGLQQQQGAQLFSSSAAGVDQSANQQEDARANRKLLGTSNIFSSLAGGHSKRGLVSSLIPQGLSSLSGANYNSYPVQQQQQQFIGGPMNLPPQQQISVSPSTLLEQSSLSQGGDACICVPFFQCKNGFLSESQLSKSQLAQLGGLQFANMPLSSGQLQVPRSGKQASDLYQYALTQQVAQQQQQQPQQLNVMPDDQSGLNQQQQVMNDMIYEQLKKNMESGQLDQQLQSSSALLDERNARQQSNSTQAAGGVEEERSIFNSLSNNRRNYQLAAQKCGIMRTCCKIPARISSHAHHQQLSAARFVNQMPTLSHQQLIASPSVSRPTGHHGYQQQQQQMAHRHLQVSRPQTASYQQKLQAGDYFPHHQVSPNLDAYQQQTAAGGNHQQLTSLGQPLVMESILQQQQQLQQQPQVTSLAIRPAHMPPGSFMSGRCGLRQTLGISGRVQNAPATQSLEPGEATADFGEFPAHAAILKRLSPGDSLFVCSAVLISGQWLATAAHCVRKHRPEELKVRLGEWDVNRDDEFYPFFETNVREIVMNPDFQASSLANDLALIRLEQPVDQQQMPHVAPACLAQPMDAELSGGGQRCWVAGWGKNAFGQQGTFQSVLKKVDLPVVSHADCELALKYQTKLGKFFRLHANNICAGGERGKDACEGDGGAGLYCLDPQSSLIKAVGLVSWGVGCGQRGVPGVYVNLANFNGWIESVVVASGEENVYLDGRAGASATNGIGEIITRTS